MYSQQQQYQHHSQMIDANNLNAYSYSQLQQQQQHRPPPPPPPHHHQQNYALVPPEPIPSATDTQPTVPLTIAELADFASSMVYLMWHARRPSVMALHEISKIFQAIHTEDTNLDHQRETANIANRTSSAFKKFCKQILSATQLSESVILLSLKYIAMLLQNNPSIQGAEGSEYRLFTVALMLANKFLDDNTFTNKTWSEVSGMKVTDLNIMELEFLDVLQFKLFIRKDEFDRWKAALLLFRSQLQNADKIQKQEQQQKLLEETFKGIVLPSVHQQQQQQQQQYQYLLMLSKAQLPHFPTQPLTRPLTRVPLRIPGQPVWRNSSQQQQQQVQQQQVQQQPPSQQPTPSFYDLQPTQNVGVRPYTTADYYNYNMSQQQGVISAPTTTATATASVDSLYHPSHSVSSMYNTPPNNHPSTTTTTTTVTTLPYSQPNHRNPYPTTTATNTTTSMTNNNNNANTTAPAAGGGIATTIYHTSANTSVSDLNSINNAASTPYYKLTPTNNMDPYYHTQQRTSFYQPSSADYTSYDMSGSNDIYSRVQPAVTTTAYQQVNNKKN
ncbi:MAG: cyclin-domain-containing protein [Benjaminiella poitrasii]|nr:MAG: cyclin-domain-containing protein [Benjaminiella poitrasii]